eukprot:g23485.t1
MRFTLRQVELVLERDDDEQGRPEDKAGWSTWLLSKTDGLTRKQRILELQPKLAHALQALHAGLTTVMLRAPGLRASLGRPVGERRGRTLKTKVPGMDCSPQDEQVLSYWIFAQTQKSYLLEFESMGRLAAETFELLLMMVEKCNGGEQLLAESVDLDAFQLYMERAGFKYSGDEFL